MEGIKFHLIPLEIVARFCHKFVTSMIITHFKLGGNMSTDIRYKQVRDGKKITTTYSAS